ncbi:unnamed protein product [Heligmosomoides polygyrus]|uniref:Uncharacterized protein n=1 Tax=Heligmosomoides polygyrus TaxID=6339 RepID=A0A183FSF2_HELPZ|nr:unnamed protein product [Heligmosomoides polygyrus]
MERANSDERFPARAGVDPNAIRRCPGFILSSGSKNDGDSAREVVLWLVGLLRHVSSNSLRRRPRVFADSSTPPVASAAAAISFAPLPPVATNKGGVSCRSYIKTCGSKVDIQRTPLGTSSATLSCSLLISRPPHSDSEIYFRAQRLRDLRGGLLFCLYGS